MKTFYLESALDNIEMLLREIDLIAISNKIDGTKKADLEIVLVELFTNIVRHGYRGESGTVKFQLDSFEREMLIEVRDNGLAFTPSMSFASLDQKEPLRESGYGMPIIMSLLSDVKFERVDDQNVFTAKFIL